MLINFAIFVNFLKMLFLIEKNNVGAVEPPLGTLNARPLRRFSQAHQKLFSLSLYIYRLRASWTPQYLYISLIFSYAEFRCISDSPQL